MARVLFFLALAAGITVAPKPAAAWSVHHGHGYAPPMLIHQDVYRGPIRHSYPPRVVVRHVYGPPRVVVRRVYRPAFYGQPVVRRHAFYGTRPVVVRHGFRHRHGWYHDRPRCWLPERYLCR